MDDLPLIVPWRRREFHVALRALLGLTSYVSRRTRRTSTGVLLTLVSGCSGFAQMADSWCDEHPEAPVSRCYDHHGVERPADKAEDVLKD
jgi:hypothetical protein